MKIVTLIKELSLSYYILFIGLAIFLCSYSNDSKSSRQYSYEESVIKDSLEVYADANFSFGHAEYQNAVKNFNLADSLGVKHPYLYFKMGVAQLNINDYKSSIINLSKCISLLPKDKELIDYFKDLEYMLMRAGDEYVPVRNYLSMEHRYIDAFYYRGAAKCLNQDFYGAIEDIRSYHLASKDSSYISCYFLAESLAKTQQSALAKKYFSYIINNADISLYSDLIGSSYYYRGIINYNIKRKEEACKDWSKATERGNEDSFKLISKYCVSNQ